MESEAARGVADARSELDEERKRRELVEHELQGVINTRAFRRGRKRREEEGIQAG
jgi:hypothetical protein